MAHQQKGAVPASDTGGSEAGAPRGDFGVEFGKGEGEVVDVTGTRATAGNLQRGAGRVRGGHEGEVARDVGVFGPFDGLRAGGLGHEWARSLDQGANGAKKNPESPRARGVEKNRRLGNPRSDDQ